MGDPTSDQPPRLTASSLWLNSTGQGPKLRIGLLLDDYDLPRFAAGILDDIQSSNFARLELVVLKKSYAQPSPKEPRSRFQSLRRRLSDPELRAHLLHALYLRYDRKKKSENHPLDLSDCGPRLSGIDSIEVEPIGKKFVHRFPPEALEQIRKKNLDVLIRFGFGILKGEILGAARYGVWSYHHGDNEFYRGGPPHFWELYEGAPLSGVVLQVLTEELDAGMVLAKSVFATHRTLRVSENRIVPYWGGSDLVIRKLHDLHQYGWDRLRAQSVPTLEYKGKKKLYRAPTNADLAQWLGPVLLKKAMRYPFRKKTVLQWKLGIRQNTTPLIESTAPDPLAGFRWIEPPRGHFWADPFLLENAGNRWVFFEDFSYREGRAGISCAEVSVDGELGTPISCLTSSQFHYSYPYMIRDGANILLIPESYDSDTVDLFRCRRFPDQWEYHRTLLRGKFVDTSIWQHEGIWWMLTTIADPHPRATRLLLFYSDSLGGDWHFHPANPLSTDVRNNRGAGRIFFHQNHWIRPSQTASPTYGYSFSLNRITELTRTTYAETLIKTITPATVRGLSGTHTYSWVDQVEIVDGAFHVPAKEALIDNGTQPMR
jgi:hypothetical protein